MVNTKMKDTLYKLITIVLFLVVLVFGASVFLGLLIITVPIIILKCMFETNETEGI